MSSRGTSGEGAESRGIVKLAALSGVLLGVFVLGRRSRVSLEGKRVVVTGANGGIGRELRAALGASGARVVGIDLDPDEEGSVFAADITDAGAVTAVIEAAAGRLGGIDLLVNNAGVGRGQDTGDFPSEGARRTLEVNLFGSWTATAAAMPHLVEARGHVVNVASGLALANVPFAAAYAASKRGLAAHSDALRMEYRGLVTASTVYPAYMRTPIHGAAGGQNAGLEGLVREEPVAYAVRAICEACEYRRRDVYTSLSSRAELFVARHLPAAVDAALTRRFAGLAGQRSAPGFLRQYAGVDRERAFRDSLGGPTGGER